MKVAFLTIITLALCGCSNNPTATLIIPKDDVFIAGPFEKYKVFEPRLDSDSLDLGENSVSIGKHTLYFAVGYSEFKQEVDLIVGKSYQLKLTQNGFGSAGLLSAEVVEITK
jgi:hypothetical protein